MLEVKVASCVVSVPCWKTNKNCSLVPLFPQFLWPSDNLGIPEYQVTHSELGVGSQGVGLGKTACTPGENPDLTHMGVMKKDVFPTTKVKAG